jgi:hypothetical protein
MCLDPIALPMGWVIPGKRDAHFSLFDMVQEANDKLAYVSGVIKCMSASLITPLQLRCKHGAVGLVLNKKLI